MKQLTIVKKKTLIDGYVKVFLKIITKIYCMRT